MSNSDERHPYQSMRLSGDARFRSPNLSFRPSLRGLGLSVRYTDCASGRCFYGLIPFGAIRAYLRRLDGEERGA